jgi:hypothetical protein
MKSAIALLAFSMVAATSGCGLVSFDVSEPIPPQVIAGSPIGALVPATLFSLPLNIDLAAETAAHGTGPAKSAHLSRLELDVSSPTDGSFDFLDSIAIKVSASGQPETEIAKLSPVPKGQKTISVPPTGGVDLLPYIKAGATIKTSATGHLPAKDTTVAGTVVINVHV